MAQKKFGTFGGVFTPSILTILGVIMYMRLPWIVGQAGLYVTIGVIVVAHILSVTTGLSVSSIATDKKVKAGGTYFIISRSLGLPIGGTLGIALFFGLSLSVSLYLIGFSESFLGFWDIPITKDNIRIAGTIALFAVGTLTFISTSLAMRTQYFIMAAIILSLVTILFGKHDYVPTEPLLNPIENAAPIILLFAIFFPAVTGFEAGVSMSGDLKDPKKSIPVGTIAAIIVGLLVYIGLAFFFAYNVSSDQLINNPNILLEISFFPPLLLAGIWGATISSAIGSILGAPRILQATSQDKITPKIFGKGFGETNEPRNALILTLIIAEAGILIGELNLIARVVSMFFITTYGFLNISSTIEKIASTDFRPSFKIPTWISIVGAITSIILMIELDIVALVGAAIIMGAIFLYLKNKELTLESGDTWEGVWSSILRSGLNRLNRTQTVQRNWRPNIILFSGGLEARPHLIEFGRWLVKKRGILSNFNLIENKNAEQLIRRPKALIEQKENHFEGIFSRELEVNDVYEGMETITKLYGFAGIEPNTVMFGWARDSKDPKAFSKLLRVYQKLDYNIFILDYDKDLKFGNNKTIDLWWRGSGNNASLALTVIKFLQLSEDWNNATARIFIVTNDSSIHNRVYKNVTQILEDHRMTATVKIINNSIENIPFSEIIKLESNDADLVILGLPEIEKQGDILQSSDKLISTLNTVLLIHASTFFKPIYIGIEDQDEFEENSKFDDSIEEEDYLQSLVLPQKDLLSKPISDLSSILKDEIQQYQNDYLLKINFRNNELIDDFHKLIEKAYSDLESGLSSSQIQKSKKVIAKVFSNYLFTSRKFVQDYQQDIIPEQKQFLSVGIQALLANLRNKRNNFFEEITYEIEPDNNELNKTGMAKLISKITPPKKIKVPLQSLVDSFIANFEQLILVPHLNNFAISNYQLISDLQKVFNSTNDSLQKIDSLFEQGFKDENFIENEKLKFNTRIVEVVESNKKKENEVIKHLKSETFQTLQNFSTEIQSENIKKISKQKIREIKKLKFSEEDFFELPNKWERNQSLISNFFIQDLYIKNFQNRIDTIIQRFEQEVLLLIDNRFLDDFEEINNSLKKLKVEHHQPFEFYQLTDEQLNTKDFIEALIKDIDSAVEAMPEQFEIINEESFQNLEQNQFSNVDVVEVNLRRYIDFTVENELIDPLQKELNSISNNLDKSVEIAQDVLRFTKYNFSQSNEKIEQDAEVNKTVLARSLERIEKEIVSIRSIKKNFVDKDKTLLGNIYDKLNPYLVVRSVGEFKHTVRTKEGREIVGTAQDKFNKIKNYTGNMIVNLIYQKSEGVLLAKKIGESTTSYQTQTGKLLNIVSKLEPKSEVINQLPFYYRQLYLGKHFKSKEFLIDRKNELELANDVVKNYNRGYKGGLLIIGDRFSGKTTLSNIVADKFFANKKIYEINPTDSGSISIEDFEKQFSISLNQQGNSEAILNSTPNNTAIIINDLELWWERSNNGFAVVEKIVSLIENYSNKIFFIVNCNKHSLQFINRIYPIENIFISAIQTQPFDAEEIKDAILMRHKSSGLKFEFENKPEEQISNLTLANLFNSYFEISNGNIGLAINAWISSIDRMKSQLLIIKKPENVKDFLLKGIDNEIFLILQQFILHKHLSRQKLERILEIDEIKSYKITESLKRSGLIVEFQSNVFYINPYVHNIISKKLIELELL